MEFCHLMGYAPVPVSDKVVCQYAAYLACRLKYHSVKQYMNIIRILHKEAGFPNPLDNNWVLETTLRGIAKFKGKVVKRKLPITPQLLLAIRGQLNLTIVEDKVFWAVCLVLFFGFFRKSNVLAPSMGKFVPDKHLTRNHVLVHPEGIINGLLIKVNWSKTIQHKERALLCPIPCLPNHPLCPTAACVSAFQATPCAPSTGPAFQLVDGQGYKPLLYNKFMSKLRNTLVSLNVNPQEYAGHSFRRGSASWALLQGIPGETIKILGDWKSQAYLSYLSVSLEAKVTTMYEFAKALPK